jgi:hypothetical protein
VQLQNEWVVRQVDNMQDYKHSLLFSLASNPDAAVSPRPTILLQHVFVYTNIRRLCART